jgi:hypothetical protein
MNITTWFTAVVEDVSDPTNSGRVRVRCLGFHTEDKSELPTEDLPWATCLLPVTSASTSGIGTSATGLVPGSWIFGFFRDGNELQDPVVLSTIASSSEVGGFSGDPFGLYGNNGGFDIPVGAISGPQGGGDDSYGGFSLAQGRQLSTLENPPPIIDIDGSAREKIISIARSRIGNTYNSGNNKGPGIAELWKATDQPNGYGQKWCAAFVCWCIQQSRAIPDANRPKTARAFGFENWAKSNPSVAKVITNPKNVNAGDFVIFGFSHIGIATTNSNENGVYKTCDGNTPPPSGSRLPWGVHEKNRTMKSVRSVVSLLV